MLFDVLPDPHESRNLVSNPAHAGTLEEMRARLDSWMRETGDPLLHGPVPAPPGANVLGAQ